jgi:hypothetical protein
LKILQVPTKAYGAKTHVNCLADFNDDEELVRRFNKCHAGDQQRVSQLVDQLEKIPVDIKKLSGDTRESTNFGYSWLDK